MSIKNSCVSFRRGHDFVTLVYLWLLCPDLLFVKTLRSQVSRVCANSLRGESLWVPSPCCKTPLPWCTTQAFSLKNATFSKLLAGGYFIIFSKNSYNFLPFKYSFISAVLLLEAHLWAETSSWASLAFTSIYENQNQHLSGTPRVCSWSCMFSTAKSCLSWYLQPQAQQFLNCFLLDSCTDLHIIAWGVIYKV